MSKLDILQRAFIGEFIKFRSNLFWGNELSKISKTQVEKIPVTVSLTSYGERVGSVVPFTIMSLLKQNVQPERIILWLDKVKWNEENLPQKLKDLQKFGLIVRFCVDIRSYTKIIPTLRQYPADTIVTVDDDLYYSSNFLNELFDLHQKSPDKIITLNFCYPKVLGNEVAGYREWSEYHKIASDSDFSKMLIFPQGFGGVLYPARSLHNDVIKEELFLKLAPHADDIWLYIMGILQGTEKECVVNTKTTYYFLDLFRQIKTRDRLHDVNVGESQNDKQLKALLAYYNISLKDYE